MTIITTESRRGKCNCAEGEGNWLQMPISPLHNHRVLFDGNFKKKKPLYVKGVLGWIEEQAKEKPLKGVVIDGPGDPLAKPEVIINALDLLEESPMDVEVVINSIGLGLADMAEVLARKKVSGVNLQVLAATPETICKLYAWIRPGKKNIPLKNLAESLFGQQVEGVKALSQAGIKVNIIITVYPQVNDGEVAEICQQMAAAGASAVCLQPFSPSEREAAVELNDSLPSVEKYDVPQATEEELMTNLRQEAEKYLPVVEVAKDIFSPLGSENDKSSGARPVPGRMNVAVASQSGLDIDLHLGQADKLLIFGPRAEDGLPSLLEVRTVAAAQGSDNRWQKLVDSYLHDCFALLTSAAGDKPRQVLAEEGIAVINSSGNVSQVVDTLYGGGKKKKC